MSEAAPDRLEILAVPGIGEIRPGADLAATVAAAAPWLTDRDVVVVTSKIVSKAEGRLLRVPTDPAAREQARQDAIAGETARVVARRGPTTIAATRHGFVLAAAGVDASNVRGDEIALLPEDSDRSAESIRAGLRAQLGVEVAVVVSDTMGRAWRTGQTDCAIGVAGITAIRDERGARDAHGNVVAVTEIAVVDEIAGAAELVKGKLGGIPVAVVRGLSYSDGPESGVQSLIRPVEQDMFALGVHEARTGAVAARRIAQGFTDEPVDPSVLDRALAAAATAPGARSCRFLVQGTGPVRIDACVAALPERAGAVARGDLVALGATVQSLLVTASADGLGTDWRAGPDDPPIENGLACFGTILIGHPEGSVRAPVPRDGATVIRRR